MQITVPTLLTVRPSPMHQSHTSIQKATGPSTMTKAICVVQRLLAPNPTPPCMQTFLPLSLECVGQWAVRGGRQMHAPEPCKQGRGGQDWVTPVEYPKINIRTVGILQVN